METAMKEILNGNLGIVLILVIFKLIEVIYKQATKPQEQKKESEELALSKEQDQIIRGVYQRTKDIHAALSKTDESGRPLYVFPSDAIGLLRKIADILTEIKTEFKTSFSEVPVLSSRIKELTDQIEDLENQIKMSA